MKKTGKAIYQGAACDSHWVGLWRFSCSFCLSGCFCNNHRWFCIKIAITIAIITKRKLVLEKEEEQN